MRLIDADALINRVVFHTDLSSDIKEVIEDEVNAEPTVGPERQTGKWMIIDPQRQEDIDNDNYMYTCTCCLHNDLHSKSLVVPYCWYCGAKMEVEE